MTITLVIARTLSGRRLPVDEPDHPLGVYSRRRQVGTVDDGLESLTLGRTRDREQHEPRAGDPREGEGHPRMGIARVGVGVQADEAPRVRVPGGGAWEERGRV